MSESPLEPTPNPLFEQENEFLPTEESQALTKEILATEGVDVAEDDFADLEGTEDDL